MPPLVLTKDDLCRESGWEVFNRRMDEQDKVVAAAAAAAKAVAANDDAGPSVTRGDLPPAMVEVLKVSLSLLRRLASRSLASSIAGPFSTGMSMWPSGHPQVTTDGSCIR